MLIYQRVTSKITWIWYHNWNQISHVYSQIEKKLVYPLKMVIFHIDYIVMLCYVNLPEGSKVGFVFNPWLRGIQIVVLLYFNSSFAPSFGDVKSTNPLYVQSQAFGLQGTSSPHPEPSRWSWVCPLDLRSPDPTIRQRIGWHVGGSGASYQQTTGNVSLQRFFFEMLGLYGFMVDIPTACLFMWHVIKCWLYGRYTMIYHLII